MIPYRRPRPKLRVNSKLTAKPIEKLGKPELMTDLTRSPNPSTGLPGMTDAWVQQREMHVATLEDTCLETCAIGDLDRLRHLLITCDADASLKKRCLEKAALEGQLDIMRYLLDSSPLIEIDSWAAWYAAWGGLEAYKLLHSKYPDIIHWYFGHHGNAVHIATRRRDAALLEYLLEHGLDPGWSLVEDSDCRAGPLMPIDNAALTSTTPEIAQILVKHGALVNGTSALEIAAQFGRLSLARYFLDQGADINVVRPRDSSWRCSTPLVCAMRAKQVEMVRFLLQNGADLNVRDGDGRSVLEEARATEHEEIIALVEQSRSTD